MRKAWVEGRNREGRRKAVRKAWEQGGRKEKSKGYKEWRRNGRGKRRWRGNKERANEVEYEEKEKKRCNGERGNRGENNEKTATFRYCGFLILRLQIIIFVLHRCLLIK